MTLWTSARSRGPGPGNGVRGWVNFYVPNGTPIRWAADTAGMAEASSDASGVAGDRPVRLVLGEQDELVIDMGTSVAAAIMSTLGAAQYAAGRPAGEPDDGAGGGTGGLVVR